MKKVLVPYLYLVSISFKTIVFAERTTVGNNAFLYKLRYPHHRPSLICTLYFSKPKYLFRAHLFRQGYNTAVTLNSARQRQPDARVTRSWLNQRVSRLRDRPAPKHVITAKRNPIAAEQYKKKYLS